MQTSSKIVWAWYHLTENEWAAFSTVAAFAGVLATAIAVYVAIRIPHKVADAAQEEARRVEQERRN